ncbi:MAG: S4 domain-containing protein [Sphaerochaetaceae bacterium]
MNIEYPLRLQSYLAKSGMGSRRYCETLIQEGRVSVNTKIVKQMGTKVEADDVVMVDNQTVEPFAKLLYFALHKPKGYVCSQR